MSWEEDYLMAKVAELDARLAKVERRTAERKQYELRSEHGPELVRLPEGSTVVSNDALDALRNEDQDGPQDEDEYGSWSFADLRTEAKRRGLNAGGTAAELAARLREDDREIL